MNLQNRQAEDSVLRVVFFMNHVDQGGAALALIDLVAKLHEDYGIECIVCTGVRNGINRWCDRRGIENHVAPFRNFISTKHKPVFMYRIALKIRHWLGFKVAHDKLVREIDFSRVDVIHSNLDRIDCGVRIAQEHRIPHIWHVREHLGTHFDVVSIYEPYAHYMRGFESEFLCISRSVEEEWLAAGLPKRDTSIVYDGVKQSMIPVKTAWFSDGKVNIVFVGGYCEEKGQRLFLERVAKLPNEYQRQITISFFGDGREKDISRLAKTAEGLGVASLVTFNPYREDIHSILRDYDLGVNFSIGEGFGRVIVEYMAAGLCVVATDGGASGELIDNMKTGLLVRRDSQESFDTVIGKLIDDRNLMRAIASRGQDRASDFSIDAHAANVVQHYRSMVAGRRRAS